MDREHTLNNFNLFILIETYIKAQHVAFLEDVPCRKCIILLGAVFSVNIN